MKLLNRGVVNLWVGTVSEFFLGVGIFSKTASKQPLILANLCKKWGRVFRKTTLGGFIKLTGGGGIFTDRFSNPHLVTSFSSFTEESCENEFNSHRASAFFIWGTRLVKGSFQNEVLTLIQLVKENRLRHARVSV